MYKLLALDMDGTLLNDNKEISQINKVAIKKAMEKGVHVVLCTGRTIQGIQKYIEELEIDNDDCYSVTCTGSYIINNTKKEIVRNTYLSTEDIRFVYNVAEKLNVNVNFIDYENIYTRKIGLFSKIDALANNLNLKLISFNEISDEFSAIKMTLINEDGSVEEEIRNIVPSIKIGDIDLESRKDYDVNLFKDDSRIPKELLKKYTVVKTTPFTLEILSRGCNKGTGVEIVAEKLGIKREETICIGDSGNDRHMIEYAGLGVAMGNAFPEIKEIADYVTLTNEEHGVAHVIEKFIL